VVKNASSLVFAVLMLFEHCAQVVLKVEMPCSGCSGAVERVLKKMEGKHRSFILASILSVISFM
jgi:hypothetical protein